MEINSNFLSIKLMKIMQSKKYDSIYKLLLIMIENLINSS